MNHKQRRRYRRSVILGYLDNYRVRAEAQRHLAMARKAGKETPNKEVIEFLENKIKEMDKP
jgi:hypothetical protein